MRKGFLFNFPEIYFFKAALRDVELNDRGNARLFQICSRQFIHHYLNTRRFFTWAILQDCFHFTVYTEKTIDTHVDDTQSRLQSRSKRRRKKNAKRVKSKSNRRKLYRAAETVLHGFRLQQKERRILQNSTKDDWKLSVEIRKLFRIDENIPFLAYSSDLLFRIN